LGAIFLRLLWLVTDKKGAEWLYQLYKQSYTDVVRIVYVSLLLNIRLGNDCGFKEAHELIVAIKYLQGQGQLVCCFAY